MESQRVILVVSSRLLRELVKRAIEKSTGLEVIRDLANIHELSSAVMETNSQWAFVVLSSNQEIPESLKIDLFSKHPELRIVGLWISDSHVKIEWLAREQKDITGMTLDQLTRLLREELHNVQATKDTAKKSK